MPRVIARPLAPTTRAGAEPKVVTEPIPCEESTTPSPSASVVVSVELVPAGGEPMRRPLPTLAPTVSAGPDSCRSSGSSLALTVGSTLRVVVR